MEKGGFPSEFMNYGNGDENPLMTTSSLLNLNWEAVQSSTEQAANFESALSSLASSPTSSSNPNPTPNLPSHSVVIRELIGRLGSICSNSNGNNSNHNSPPNSQYQSTSTSCYTAPLHSPPNLSFRLGAHHQPPVMPPFAAADPGFAERAAKFSCFGATRNYAPFCEPGSLSSGQSLKAMDDGASFQLMQQQQLLLQDGDQGGGQSENIEMIRRLMMIKSGNGHSGGIAEPSVSGNANVRKRKASSSSKGVSRGKDGAPDNPPKAAAEEKPSSKRCRSGGEPDEDEVKTPKAEQAVNNGTGTDTTDTDSAAGNKDKDSNAKAPEPPKQDYIHVRARRGQATDSHSLAERVRREKISERMKFLQDLVPGCDKVTGKAVMLDEIINYVQSLQRQVEFLSMKLATVNPLADISVDSLLPKDMHQPGGLMLAPHSSYPLEATSIGMFSYANQPQEQVPPLQSLISNGLETPLDASIRRSLSMHLPSLDGLTDASASQLGAFWEDDDLQSVVQMGFGQNQELIFSSQNFPGPPPTSHMKIEL